MLVGGERLKPSHRSRVVLALYLPDFCDKPSKAAKPSSLPLVARQHAMPIRFQFSQSKSSLGIAAIAAVRMQPSCNRESYLCWRLTRARDPIGFMVLALRGGRQPRGYRGDQL